MASIGMRMSEKRMAASKPKISMGCRVTSAAELRAFAQLQKADFAADLLVFGQVPAGLAHEPDRGVVGAFPAAGLEKGIVHCCPFVCG